MPNYRLPNGYGSVVKLSGHRRNPYAVRKTLGYDDRAYPIYAIIGYYPTRKDALMALAEYNNDPFDVDLSKLTFKEMYERWAETELPKLGKSLASAHRASFKYCKPLYNLKYRDIRKFNMQRCIDACGKGYSTRNNIRNLFVTLDKYAFDQDIIRKCYSTNLEIGEREETRKRDLFTDQEVQTLWNHVGEPYVDETLFQLYTGTRVSEMLLMKCEDIDLDQMTMRGGIKTAAGKNRIIPIHDELLPIIKAHYKDSGFLFDHPRSETARNAETALRTKYLSEWNESMTALGLTHTTHDCRHTFRTKLDGSNKVCVDLIMGHSSKDVGERVYTHKTIEQLKNTINELNFHVSVSAR